MLSALGDSRAPDRQSLTREFFDRIEAFDVSTSELTRTEAEGTRDPRRSSEIVALLRPFSMLPITPESQVLAQRYMAAGIFPATVPEDALHVAIAVLSRQEALVSWNFKHLVNQGRRTAVQALNGSLSLPEIDIVPPPEL